MDDKISNEIETLKVTSETDLKGFFLIFIKMFQNINDSSESNKEKM